MDRGYRIFLLTMAMLLGGTLWFRDQVCLLSQEPGRSGAYGIDD